MRILGIDLGSTSIKAVEVDSAFGRYEIREYYEQKIEAGADPHEVARAMIAALPKVPDRVVASMHTSQVTMRNLTLPVKDKKAILASVGFELEDDLPFSMENAVYDYAILSQQGQTSQVHVSATLKKYVEHALTQLSLSSIDPDLLTTETWAYRILLNRVVAPGEQERPVLLVQLGHERSVLYVHWKGQPILVREIRWGGQDLTVAICQKYGIPVDQAEQTKLDHGFVLPQTQRGEATQDQVEFSETLIKPIQELVQELRQLNLTAKSLTQKNIGLIYMAGGTSLLPGILRVIEEELQITVRPLQSLSAIATSGVTYSEHTDASFTLAAALALCLVGSERSTIINFRKGIFSKSGPSREVNLANLKRPLAAVAAICLCMVLSMAVQSSVYKNRIKEADKKLEKSVKEFFPTVSSSGVRTYLGSTSTLKTAVNKELGKQRELAKLLGPNSHSPLDFLREISTTIPKDTVVDLTSYQVGSAPAANFNPAADATASLTLLVDNAQAADRLSTLMNTKITGIQKTQPEEVADPYGKGKRWKITLSGKVEDTAYGK